MSREGHCGTAVAEWLALDFDPDGLDKVCPVALCSPSALCSPLTPCSPLTS